MRKRAPYLVHDHEVAEAAAWRDTNHGRSAMRAVIRASALRQEGRRYEIWFHPNAERYELRVLDLPADEERASDVRR
jgi:hypothetical protein